MIVVILTNFSAVSQEKVTLNHDFYHIWLWSDFYKALMSNKTPCELYPLPSHTMQLYFNKDKDEVLYGTFHEGITKKFRVINKDTIEVIDAENKSKRLIIYLSKIMGQSNLVIKDEGKTFIYSALDDKYNFQNDDKNNFRNGVDCFINDKFFTGTYISETDSAQKIIFTSDGRIKGINDFNEYWLPIESVPLPREFDIISLEEIDTTHGMKVINSILLNWGKTNNKIILHNISNSSDDPNDIERYLGSKILDHFLTLKKVE